MSEVPAQSVTLELLAVEVERLDAWIAAQPPPRPSRPEAARELLVAALSKTRPAPPSISDEASIPEGKSGAAEPYDGAPM